MFKYILKRLFLSLFTFFIIISLCFIFVKLLPISDPDQFGQDMTLIIKRREALGYYDPLPKQYWIFITKTLIGGDWGVGEVIYQGKDVWDTFVLMLPPTILVNLYAMIFSVPIGIAFGIYAALKKNRWQDSLISTLVMVVVSVPSYVYAFLVQYFLCYQLQWFPFLMENGTDYFSWKMFVSLVPAILSLSFGEIASLTRYTRAELTEVLTSDFMLLARTKGLTKAQATTRHALKNAMVPIFPSIIGGFISILSGSLIIESIFGIPGVGGLYVRAVTGKAGNPDYNFFLLISAFYTLIGLLGSIVIDISYGVIDPRIRMGER
ncbi:MAG: ABC transporter permease [Bacilli bacterium]|nr:ABC transporter permease [Bacilli bacterium]